MARHKKLETVEDEDPKLDISSLIDVCFLLLIYFIVATSLIQERKLDMSMPGQSMGENASQIEPALIRIIKDGTIYWGKDNSLMIDNDMNNHNLATLVQQLEAKKQEASAVGTKPVVNRKPVRTPHRSPGKRPWRPRPPAGKCGRRTTRAPANPAQAGPCRTNAPRKGFPQSGTNPAH